MTPQVRGVERHCELLVSGQVASPQANAFYYLSCYWLYLGKY